MKSKQSLDEIALRLTGKEQAVEDRLLEETMDFSIRVLSFVGEISGHASLKNQLERSATSIGANVREAKYGHSRADFVSKMQIALKECYEAEYWLELFQRAGLASFESTKGLKHRCGSIRKILIASINTAKKKKS